MKRIHQNLFRNLFQICSDLHINQFKYQIKIKPEAPHLLIAGDLDNGVKPQTHQYLRKLAQNYESVTLIPGNHDLFGCPSLQVGLAEFKDLERVADNVTVLINQGQSFQCKENYQINIFGCILWSELPREHWNHYRNINRSIKNQNGLRFTPQDHHELHQYDADGLLSLQKEHKNKDLDEKFNDNSLNINNQINVIMTHYPPLIKDTCKKIYYQSPQRRLKYLNHSFCTDLGSSVLSSDMLPDSWKVWIFGHTHWPCDFWYQDRINMISQPYVGRRRK